MDSDDGEIENDRKVGYVFRLQFAITNTVSLLLMDFDTISQLVMYTVSFRSNLDDIPQRGQKWNIAC